MKTWTVVIVSGALLAATGAKAQDAEVGKAAVDQMLGLATEPAPVACTDENEELYPIECGQTAEGKDRAWRIPKRATVAKPLAGAAAAARASSTPTVRTAAVTPRAPRRAAVAAATAAVATDCAMDMVDGAAANLCATFASGSARLSVRTEETLKSVARSIATDARLRGRKLLIEGHADATGDAARNKALSAERAKAVMDYLIANGVPSERLSAEGFGSERPVKGRAPTDPANRRVQVRIQQS